MMKSSRYIGLWLVALSGWLMSCQQLHEWRARGSEEVIAEVEGARLTRYDVEAVTRDLLPEDSARVAEAYVRQWVSDRLVLREAHDATNEQIDSLVTAYRDRLCVEAYSEQLVKKVSSRTINDSVEAYYETHSSQFKLQESLVKGILVIVPVDAPYKNKLKGWLAKPEADNLEHLEKYVYQYAQGYELFIDTWHTENQILLSMPLDRDGFRKKIQKGGLVEAQDSTSTYLLQVTDKLEFGEEMPLEFARPKIEKIVRAEMQQRMLQKERDKLYRSWKD